MSRKRSGERTDRSYEDSQKALELRAKCAAITGAEIAARLGLTKGYVNNLLRARKQLAEPLLDRWKQGMLITDLVFRLAREKDPATQWEMFQESAARPLSRKAMTELLEACEASARSSEWKKGAREVLGLVLNGVSIPAVWPRSRVA